MLTPEQRGYMEKWKFELRYGGRNQTQGLLKDKYGYCCLGVAAETLGRKFILADGYDIYHYVDEELKKRESALSLGDQASMGLNTPLSDEDVEELISAGLINPNEFYQHRMSLLAYLNDRGMSFKHIVDVIEQLGWDR